jgi:hypothetical protein
MVRQQRSMMVAKDEQLRWVNMRCVAHLPNSGDNPFQIESPIDFFSFCDFITLLEPNNVRIGLHFLCSAFHYVYVCISNFEPNSTLILKKIFFTLL